LTEKRPKTHPFDYPIVQERTDRVERISMRSVLKAILNAFDLERGFFFTLLRLYSRGGKAVLDYLGPNRQRYTPPFRFLLILTALALFALLRSTWVNEFFSGFVDALDDIGSGERQQVRLTLLGYFNVFLWLSIPIFSGFTRLFFPRPFNYAEHLVLHAYFVSAWNALLFVLFPLQWVLPASAQAALTLLLFILGLVAFYRTFFGFGGWRFGWRTLLVLLLGSLVYFLMLSFILGAFIGVQTKME